jgi:hypothetical protein
LYTLVFEQDSSGKTLVVWSHHSYFHIVPPCISDYYHFQPFTAGFPRADIHELLSPDLLHQLIKGAFKDHLVTWVNNYIKAEYSPSEAQKRLDDIDRRYLCPCIYISYDY